MAKDNVPSEELKIAAVKYCHEHELNYTLGTMLEMARFAAECIAHMRTATSPNGPL